MRVSSDLPVFLATNIDVAHACALEFQPPGGKWAIFGERLEGDPGTLSEDVVLEHVRDLQMECVDEHGAGAKYRRSTRVSPTDPR